MIHAAKRVGRHGVRDAAIILLMFRHGLRTAELVALKWSQVDLVGGYIEIHRVKQGHDSIHPLRSPERGSLAPNPRKLPRYPVCLCFRTKSPSLNPFNSPYHKENRRNSPNSLSSSSPSIAPCLRLLFSSPRT
jgi:integrase